MIKDWERPLVKGSTHEKAVDFSKDTGLKLWAIYDAAIEMFVSNAENACPSELGVIQSKGGELTNATKA